MKYSAAVLSLAAVAAARPAFTNLQFDVTEGEPFTLEFTGCEGGCTISLKNGERGDLKDVQQLTGAAEGGSFTFTLDSVPSDTYTFEIVNNETGEDNYSQQFQYEGEAAAPTTSAAEETTVTTSVVETVTTPSSTPEETTTEATSTEESTSMTTPSASTTVTSTETSTPTGKFALTSASLGHSLTPVTDESTSTTDGGETSQTSEIPAPDDAAVALGTPMTLIVAAVAGLLMFN